MVPYSYANYQTNVKKKNSTINKVIALTDETRLHEMGVDDMSIRRNEIRQAGPNLNYATSRYSTRKSVFSTNIQPVYRSCATLSLDAGTPLFGLLVHNRLYLACFIHTWSIPSLSISTLSFPHLSRGFTSKKHFVNSHNLDKWELTKWEIDKMGVDEMGIDHIGRYP